MVVSGLEPGTYYFAIKTIDHAGKASALSNSARNSRRAQAGAKQSQSDQWHESAPSGIPRRRKEA
jgi:hypothetical protein